MANETKEKGMFEVMEEEVIKQFENDIKNLKESFQIKNFSIFGEDISKMSFEDFLGMK